MEDVYHSPLSKKGGLLANKDKKELENLYQDKMKDILVHEKMQVQIIKLVNIQTWPITSATPA